MKSTAQDFLQSEIRDLKALPKSEGRDGTLWMLQMAIRDLRRGNPTLARRQLLSILEADLYNIFFFARFRNVQAIKPVAAECRDLKRILEQPPFNTPLSRAA